MTRLQQIALLIFILTCQFTQAQKYITREAYIRFYGHTAVEDIEAVTKQGASVLDAENGDFVFQVLISSFTFEKALMQEHFNENYAESETYPKAIFKGKVQDWSANQLSTDKKELKVNGTMTFHGVSKEITVPITLFLEGEQVNIKAVFEMVPEDYDISIPSAVRDKIARSFKVTVKALYNKN